MREEIGRNGSPSREAWYRGKTRISLFVYSHKVLLFPCFSQTALNNSFIFNHTQKLLLLTPKTGMSPVGSLSIPILPLCAALHNHAIPTARSSSCLAQACYAEDKRGSFGILSSFGFLGDVSYRRWQFQADRSKANLQSC